MAPDPSTRFAASTVPPCSSTRWRTIASPRPRPPCGRVLELSRLAEALEDVRQEVGRDAGPVVLHGQSRAGVDALDAHAHPCPPRGVNLIAFESRFQTTCCSRSGVARERTRRRDRARSRRGSPSPPPPAARSRARPRRRRPGPRRRSSSRSLPVMMRDTSRMSSISCACSVRVAVDGVERLLRSAPGRAGPSAGCASSRRSRSAACAARARAWPGTRPSCG